MNRWTIETFLPHLHGVWKSQKKSHLERAKRATFTFWVDKSSLKMPKMVHFGEVWKIWTLQSNSITRHVNLKWKMPKLNNSNETFLAIFKNVKTYNFHHTWLLTLDGVFYDIFKECIGLYKLNVHLTQTYVVWKPYNEYKKGNLLEKTRNIYSFWFVIEQLKCKLENHKNWVI